jgi:hypothetical protein
VSLAHAYTERCAAHGHPEFRVVYDCDLMDRESVRALLDPLEEMVAGGTRLQPGEVFQLGWMALRVAGNDAGWLSLLEPDMIHTPMYWVESVTHALIHLNIHGEVCGSVDGITEPVYPTQLHSARICQHLGTTDGFFMSRREPAGADCGWDLVCSPGVHDLDDPQQLLSLSLYDAVVGYEPQMLPYLALPPAVTVDYRGRAPVISLDGSRMSWVPGSALDKRFGR